MTNGCPKATPGPVSLHCRPKLATDCERDQDIGPIVGQIDRPNGATSAPVSLHSQVTKGCSITNRIDHALSLARPLRRRERRTARPPRVDMRLRNPCLVERFRLFGWNVRFIGNSWLGANEVACGGSPATRHERASVGLTCASPHPWADQRSQGDRRPGRRAAVCERSGNSLHVE